MSVGAALLPVGPKDYVLTMVHPAPPLRPDQFERYQRHLNLPEFGLEGQRRLLESSVLVIGAGGLGCPLTLYLTAAGVGRIGLVDFDVVDRSNLQRQVLYGTADVGRPKVEVARERLRALNPDTEVVALRERVTSENGLALLEPWDVVVDGTDNFPTRYLSNDACVLLGKPSVYGAILRFEGQATTFDGRRGPCYRCLFPEPPPAGSVPSCAEGGVLGVLPGIVAMIQATEVVKLLTGAGEPLIGRFLHYDALAMRFTEFRFPKDPACPVCGEQPTVTELIDYEGFCGAGAPREEGISKEVSAAEVQARSVRGEPFVLLDVREPHEAARACIEPSVLVPLGQLESRIAELLEWKDRPVVVYCHHGGRSARACEILARAGFTDLANLQGGIDAWSLTVDPTVPRY
jgi:sulfur-carrier protein adenylyltransferase/sulfurtransferase